VRGQPTRGHLRRCRPKGAAMHCCPVCSSACSTRVGQLDDLRNRKLRYRRKASTEGDCR